MVEELSDDGEEDAFSFRQGEMIGEKNDRLERWRKELSQM